MNIAIVGPSPVPYVAGGAEQFIWGLCGAINAHTPHHAELIKLPSREHSFWGLIHAYYDFYTLDLSHFDLVISTKYPSWMVRHRNRTCYMLHTLRGLYDTYPSALGFDVPRTDALVNAVLDEIDAHPDTFALDALFDKLFALERHQHLCNPSFFALPGPLIRKIVRHMDRCAFLQPGTQRYFAISQTVAARADYFPPGARVQVVYPPSSQRQLQRAGGQRHVFTVSRLDAPKRMDLLVRAYAQVQSDLPLYIAGTGPQQAELQALAAQDPRIHLLGYLSDEQVAQYYADSLVVPYLTAQEDYGLVTLEAMMHRKPVIAAADAGGPLEFVEDGANGLVVEPTPQAVAQAIDALASDPARAARMGACAFETVRHIDWAHAVDSLLRGLDASGRPADPFDPARALRLVIPSTFPIYPPQGGGQARIFGLYEQVARTHEVEAVCIKYPAIFAQSREIAPHFSQRIVEFSEAHQAFNLQTERAISVPVEDALMLDHYDLTPAFTQALSQSIQAADAVIFSHPYTYEAAKAYLGGKPFVYEAHNVEFLIKRAVYPADNAQAQQLLQRVFEVESACCQHSAFIMTCSDEDRHTLHELYHTPMDKILVVPNGVDVLSLPFTPIGQRLLHKRAAGLMDARIGLFIGSYHKPNLEACEVIFQLAQQCPDTTFLLLGGQCNAFAGREVPQNVALLGFVSEEEKRRLYAVADFALNPMQSGSGTNLKMFDYLAAGLPVLTTAFGTRGIDRKDVFTIAEVDQMAQAIHTFDLLRCHRQVQQGRAYVENTFDWQVIARPLLQKLETLRTRAQ